jgi:hypothetical protein
MDWLAYFERNRASRMEIPWERGIAVEPDLRVALIHSLRRFQVGEQGDGNHLKRGAAATGDPAYVATIALFIQEEQEHARLLARLLQGMDAQLLRKHWSDTCFIILRRLASLHLELLVLLIAELIAKRYYRALYEGIDDLVLKAAFAQILHDENGHVAFHCDYLRQAFSPLPAPVRFLICINWRLLFRGVCAIVMLDHRTVLRATHVSFGAFWRDCGSLFDEAAACIFATAPAISMPEMEGNLE